jgi:signal transduction histidine kinase
VSIKILIIDDEELIRNLWNDYLSSSSDYSIDIAIDGESGIAKLREKDFDIVVTDLNMPGISGIEVVEKVKKIKPEMEVIVMTAFGTVEFAVNAMKKGAYDFVLKPLDFEQIKIVIRKCYQQILYKRENKDLKELNIKLKELNEAKEKFITITSHEIRTPANAISGLTELVYEGLPPEVKGKLASEFDILMTACNDLRDIVQNMHDLSIANAGSLNINKYHFNFDNLEKELIREYKLYSRDRKLSFQFDNELKEGTFFGDFRRIKQAGGELLQNAVKFTKDGGTVKVKFDNEKIERTNYFVMEVTDTGIGLATDEVNKVFETFYEAQDTSKHHTSKTEFMGGGMGIGLAIAKEIAMAHKGKITVYSEPGSGSSFKLYLPYEDLS